MMSRVPSYSDVEIRQLNIWASPSANPGRESRELLSLEVEVKGLAARTPRGPKWEPRCCGNVTASYISDR